MKEMLIRHKNLFNKSKKQLLPTHYSLPTRKGFTLIEMMFVIALMVAIGGVSAPIYQSFQVKNDLDVVAYTIAQTLRRAQILSQSGAEDSSWGVRIASDRLTLFKGADFSGRDTEFDEVSEISSSITPSGIQDIIYSKILGEPQVTGSIVLTTSNNDVANITINEKGTIEY